MTIFHMKQSIAGCLRNNRIGTIDFLEDGEGNSLSDSEARLLLNKMLKQGQTVMQVGDDCEGFDVFGGGCPGHEPLSGSDLTRAMLKRGDKHVMCFISDLDEEDAIESKVSDAVIGSDNCFETHGSNWFFAVPINNQGEPLTAKEAGL